MERHHEVALQQALDQVYLEGATCIRWDHLYHWFKAERLNRVSYRQINDRWIELCTETYGHAAAPPLEVLSLKYTLTIRRAAFEGQIWAPLGERT